MNKELLELINRWLYHNNKMKEVNKYLFDHTELFESKYMMDFNDELFRFFAGKITRFATDHNRIYKILTEEQIRELNKIRIMEK